MTDGAGQLTRILVVDDDDLLLRATKRLLTRPNREVVTAMDADAALNALRTATFDAIVSDIRMPRLSGIDLLREVRRRQLDVPVILVSGSPDTQTAIEAVELGAYRYLPKPLDYDVFVGIVDQAVNMGRLAVVKRQAMELAGHDDRLLGDRVSLESRYASALEGLWIAFQPIVSLKQKSRSVAYEALLRTDEETLRNPIAFLTAAERLNRVQELSRKIRATIASAADAAPSTVDIYVNIAAVDLLDPDLSDPAAPLSKLAERVVLELTERTSLEGMADIRKRIAALRALGFRIAIDDLGSGYAGLSSLAALEPDVVKIDMSLIRDINADRRRQQVVLSLIELCSSLGMNVVVEGVETEAERETLAGLGCDLAQGYLFARPAKGFGGGIVSAS